MRRMLVVAVIGLVLLVPTSAASPPFDRTLDGGGNNLLHADWGQAGTQYPRAAAPNYADGVSTMVSGPRTRYVSNRIFNDVGQNLFSENGVSQWGWVWGQFMDHDFGLRNETPGEHAPIAFDSYDRLESFTNDVVPSQQRQSATAAIQRLVASAWLLDMYGDQGDRQKLAEAYTVFASAVKQIDEIFSR